MRENTFVHKLTKILLDILIAVGVICTLGSVQISKFLRDSGGHGDDILIPFAVTIFLSGALAVFILFTLRMMFKTLLNDDPFVMENVSALRKISVASALIAVIYFVKCFYLFTFMTLAVCATFCVATLFCLTLKDVFKRAVVLRLENDLTI